MHPSSTRNRKPSVAFLAEPCGSPFSGCSTNSTGRSSSPCSAASSNASRWILSYPPPGPSSALPSHPILMGSTVSLSCGFDLRPSNTRASRRQRPGLRICAWPPSVSHRILHTELRQLQDCSGVPPLYYDPYDAEIDADPYPVWKRMRDEAPLYYNERHDFYALTRFADVLQASLEWQTYSSARGTVLEMIDTTADDAEAAMADAGLGMMIFLDPPDHDDLRRVVSRAFTPRRVRTLEGRARQLCAQFLDPERDGDGFDYVEVLAAKIPTMVIGALLGIPDDDQDMLRKWIDAMMLLDDGDPQIAHQKLEAVGSIGPYIEELVNERRRAPQDDLLSELLAADLERRDGSHRKLDHREVMAFFTLLEFAGSETTARLLGWMAVLFARHPEQRALLVAQPDLIPHAVEELLR